LNSLQNTQPWPEEKNKVRLVGHSDLNGWGDAFQIQVHNGLCYVAASGAKGHNGMTILDVSDPTKPRVLHQIDDGPGARTHKVLRINDGILLTNSEKRRDSEAPEVKGGLRIFDLKDPAKPKFLKYIETGGIGIHRPIYDRKRNLLYSSGFQEGFAGAILLIHDMKDPWNPELIGRGWIEGQHVDGGEKPSWDKTRIGRRCHLHEGNPYGNHVTCGFWDAGIAMFDTTEPTKPEFLWRQNPHETHGWPGCYHTFLVPEGSPFGIVAQETTSINCEQPPAFITFYDLRNYQEPLPISTFMPYEIDPVTMLPLDKRWCTTGGRYGAHNIWLDMTRDDLLYICWFNAGLRIVDWSNPFNPKEVGYYIPAGTEECPYPQSNDVYVDRQTGLIYLADRWGLGLHILEYEG